MSFTDAVRTCINKFATFDGRATRSEFWWFYLFAVLVGFIGYVPILILTLIGASSNDGAISGIFTILTVIFWIVWLIVVIALYIPAAGCGQSTPARPRAVGLAAAARTSCPAASIVLIVFFVMEGTPGDNAYGPKPA